MLWSDISNTGLIWNLLCDSYKEDLQENPRILKWSKNLHQTQRHKTHPDYIIDVRVEAERSMD